MFVGVVAVSSIGTQNRATGKQHKHSPATWFQNLSEMMIFLVIIVVILEMG